MNSVKCKTKLYPDLEILISPIKGCAELRIKQLLTIYQGVYITYFNLLVIVLVTTCLVNSLCDILLVLGYFPK